MKIAIGIIVVILVVGAGYLVFVNMTQAPAPNPAAGIVETGNLDAETMGPAGEQGAVPAATVVTYTDAGFSPKTVTVPVGTTVRFVNNSTRSMWVGSDDHPAHTKYDGTTLRDHCASKTSFDQCAGEPAGTSYEFTFTKAGSFGYHNHTRANDGGTVVVQ